MNPGLIALLHLAVIPYSSAEPVHAHLACYAQIAEDLDNDGVIHASGI